MSAAGNCLRGMADRADEANLAGLAVIYFGGKCYFLGLPESSDHPDTVIKNAATIIACELIQDRLERLTELRMSANQRRPYRKKQPGEAKQ